MALELTDGHPQFYSVSSNCFFPMYHCKIVLPHSFETTRPEVTIYTGCPKKTDLISCNVKAIRLSQLNLIIAFRKD